MKILAKKSGKLLPVVLLLITVTTVLAPSAALARSYEDMLNLKCETIPDCIKDILFFIMKNLALPIAVIFIIWSGFLFISSGGNEQKLTTAKNTFFWSLIGLAIVVGAWILAEAFQLFFENL